MVVRRSAVRTARHCDTALAPGSLGEDCPPTICARGGRLSRLGRTFPRIVPDAGYARASLRCSPDAEDVTPCDNRVALYTPKATALVALRRRNATRGGLLPSLPPRPQADEAGAEQQQRGGFGNGA